MFPHSGQASVEANPTKGMTTLSFRSYSRWTGGLLCSLRIKYDRNLGTPTQVSLWKQEQYRHLEVDLAGTVWVPPPHWLPSRAFSRWKWRQKKMIQCNFQLSPPQYQLRAVVVHMGGIHSGHYVTYRFVIVIQNWKIILANNDPFSLWILFLKFPDEAHSEAKVETDGFTLLTQQWNKSPSVR